MSSKHTDDEARLAWLLSQIQDRHLDGGSDLGPFVSELDDLSAEDLEQLVEGNDCLRLLQDLSELGEQDRSKIENSAASDHRVTVPKSVGKYAIKQNLGSGGFADVYFATDTRLDRDVAIKILKSRYQDNIDVVRRFEREGHAAASLAHPTIVPIYEAGRDGAETYIAMQYCRGGDLRQYLDSLDDRLEIRRAIQIGQAVADAIGLAHSKSILHRDIKPANILLTEPPNSDSAIESLLRVSDFGLVKEPKYDPDLTNDGAEGSHDSAIGTPAYMSPEQTEGKELTPASDVFSLGILLYELLTGTNPHRQASRAETFNSIRQQAAPSIRRLRPEVDIDLQAIVEKCLAKSPSERYATGMHLANDLERWLDGKPVKARRPTQIESAWKWCRNNPLAAVSVAVAVASLILGTCVATWKWRDALKQQRVAVHMRERAELSEEETDSLLEVVFQTIGNIDPTQGGDARIDAADFLRRTKEKIDKRLPSPSEKKWELIKTLADSGDGIGQYELSAELWHNAEELAKTLFGIDDSRTMSCLAKRATALQNGGELTQSLELRSKLLPYFQENYGADASETLQALSSLGLLQLEAGWSDLAFETMQQGEATEVREEQKHNALSSAVELLQRQSDLLTKRFGSDHESIVPTKIQLSRMLYLTGNRRAAVDTMNDAIDLSEELFTESDVRTIEAKTALVSMASRKNAKKAVELMQSTLHTVSERFAVDHPVTLRVENALASCLWLDDQTELALETLTSAQQRCLARYGPVHPESISLTKNLVFQLRLDGSPEQALLVANRVLEPLSKRVGSLHRGYVELEHFAGQSLRDVGRHDEAYPIFLRHAKQSDYQSRFGLRPQKDYIGSLWILLVEMEECEQAIPWIERFLEDATDRTRSQQSQILAKANLVLCLMKCERWEDARNTFDALTPGLRRRSTNGSIVAGLHACLLTQEGNYVEARKEIRSALRGLEQQSMSLRRHHRVMAGIVTRLMKSLLVDQNESDRANRLEETAADYRELLRP